MYKFFTLLALFVFATSCFADQSAPSCGVFLARSTMLQSPAKSQEANDFPAAYLSLLNLVIEGIDQIDANTFARFDREQLKTKLLQEINDSPELPNPLIVLERAIPGISRHSATLSALADNDPFKLLLESFPNQESDRIREAVQQKIAQLHEVQTQQNIAHPETENDFLDTPDLMGDTRLHRLIRDEQFVEAYQLVTSSKVTTIYINQLNRREQTAFDMVRLLASTKRFESDLDLAQLRQALLEKYGLTKDSILGLRSDLYEAAFNGNLEEIQRLYDLGVIFGTLGTSALTKAIENNQLEATKLLIKLGANINGRDNKARIPIVYAVMRDSSIEILQVLLAAYRDSGTLYKHLEKAFLAAIEYGRIEAMKLLISYGATGRSAQHKLNAWHLAASHFRNAEAVMSILEQLPIRDLINQQGGHEGDTPLTYAVAGQNAFAVEKLIELGADKEISNATGFKPFDLTHEIINPALRDRIQNALNKPRSKNP